MLLTTIAWPAKSHRLLVLGGSNGKGEEDQALHPHYAQGRGGGHCRECQPGGGEEVSQDLESCQGLQGSCPHQLQGQPKEILKGLEH